MSAKTKSEGDADSYCKSHSPNACSGSSSYRNIQGGPYGDIPPDSNRQGVYKDYVVFMLQDNECSTGTSEYTDGDDDEQDLYSLRNEYLQKLNIVRKRLNLAEISEDGDKYFSGDYQRRCTITEIIDDDEGSSKAKDHRKSTKASAKASSEEKSQHRASSKGSARGDSRERSAKEILKSPSPKITTETAKSSNVPPKSTPIRKQISSIKPVPPKKPESVPTSSSDQSGSIEIKTIHPFSLCYNKIDANSITNLLEIEYNPPKKKSCFRLHTPKLPSASESHIPYHTKVSLHEGLFRTSQQKKSRENSAADKKLSTAYMEKFTVTREIQCNEVDFKSRESLSKVISHNSLTNLSKHSDKCSSKPETPRADCINLFPKVIVKYESPRQVVISSASTSATVPSPVAQPEQETTTGKVNPPNYIEEYSPAESYNTVTTSTTILEGVIKERVSNKSKSKSKKDNVWQELRKLNTRPEILVERKPKTKKEKNTFVQYITYRKEKKRAKSTPIKVKSSVPCGPLILHDYEKLQNIDSRFYLFNSTSTSDEEKYARDLYLGKFDSPHSFNKNAERNPSSLSVLVSCWRSILDVFRKWKRN